ncbi:hypothetical protein HK405_002481, partial [Cladochytrium tenue]
NRRATTMAATTAVSAPRSTTKSSTTRRPASTRTFLTWTARPDDAPTSSGSSTTGRWTCPAAWSRRRRQTEARRQHRR